jgi:hypothetical protein
MSAQLPDDIGTGLSDSPVLAALVLIVIGASVIAAVGWPYIRQARIRRRIRNLPPPPVRVVREPELRLPRRRSGSGPPDAAS